MQKKVPVDILRLKAARIAEAMQQLTLANKGLREALDRCEDGMIEGYLDLEIANIDKFMGDLVESTKALVVNMDLAWRACAESPRSKKMTASTPS